MLVPGDVGRAVAESTGRGEQFDRGGGGVTRGGVVLCARGVETSGFRGE